LVTWPAVTQARGMVRAGEMRGSDVERKRLLIIDEVCEPLFNS
jgi:hypothetical protein